MIHVVEWFLFFRQKFKALIHRMRHESDLNDLEEAFGDKLSDKEIIEGMITGKIPIDGEDDE